MQMVRCEELVWVSTGSRLQCKSLFSFRNAIQRGVVVRDFEAPRHRLFLFQTFLVNVDTAALEGPLLQAREARLTIR